MQIRLGRNSSFFSNFIGTEKVAVQNVMEFGALRRQGLLCSHGIDMQSHCVLSGAAAGYSRICSPVRMIAFSMFDLMMSGDFQRV